MHRRYTWNGFIPCSSSWLIVRLNREFWVENFIRGMALPFPVLCPIGSFNFHSLCSALWIVISCSSRQRNCLFINQLFHIIFTSFSRSPIGRILELLDWSLFYIRLFFLIFPYFITLLKMSETIHWWVCFLVGNCCGWWLWFIFIIFFCTQHYLYFFQVYFLFYFLSFSIF